MNNYKKVAVLMGGTSAEREVSLNSGLAVHEALQRQGIDSITIDIKDEPIIDLNEQDFDIAFIALHGRGGEDGVMQALLEVLNIPYTGSGVLGSALSMDKLRTKQIWKGAGINTPAYKTVHEIFDVDQLNHIVSYPVMVKPATEGSSIGMSKVLNSKDITSAVQEARKYDNCVIVEEWINGEEYTAAIIGAQVLPLIRLKTPESFYDYEAKYKLNSTEYFCPAGLAASVESELSMLSKMAFDSVGASGWGRVDFILDDNGDPWFLEVNTSPGMTDHSLVPMAAKAAGYDLGSLVKSILDIAWSERLGEVGL